MKEIGKLNEYLFKNTTVKKILTNSSWIFGERVYRNVLVLIISIFLARFLGPKLFGTYNYVVAFSTLIMQAASLGFSGLVVEEFVKRRHLKGTILYTTLLFRFVTSSFLALFAFVVANYIGTITKEVQFLIFIYCLGLTFNSFEIFDLWFRANELNRFPAISRGGAATLNFVLILSGIYFDASLSFFIFIAASEFFFIGLFYFVSYYKKGGKVKEWRFSFKIGISLLSKSWPLILSILGVAIYKKIDQVMLGNMIGDSQVGIYAVAAKLSEATYYLPIAVTRAAFPTLVKAKRNNKNEYNRKLQKLYDNLFIAGAIIAVSVTLVGPFAIDLLFGEEYSKSGIILTIHIWACVFIFMREALSKWLILEKLFIFSLVTHGVGALVNIGFNYILIPYYEGIGAAIATVVSYSAASYLALFLHKKTIEAGMMMTKSLLLPFRFVYNKIVM